MMFHCAHDPGLAAFLAPEYGVQEDDPLPSRAEVCLALISFALGALLLAAL
ncbi:hypothetical protein ACSSV4_004384 [Roseovarius sp. MBR-154]|jgi:hypothetical protein